MCALAHVLSLSLASNDNDGHGPTNPAQHEPIKYTLKRAIFRVIVRVLVEKSYARHVVETTIAQGDVVNARYAKWTSIDRSLWTSGQSDSDSRCGITRFNIHSVYT